MRKVCPICNVAAFQPVWQGNEVVNGCCGVCGHVYAITEVDESYEAFGQSARYQELADSSHPLFSLAQERIEIIERFMPLANKRILEVGAGYGHFLNKARDAGAVITGYEPGRKGVDFAKKQFGLDGIKAEVYEPFSRITESMDLVAGFHVLEHVEEPRAYVQSWAASLTTGGFLAIAVPNLYTLHPDLHELYFISRGWHRHTFSPGVLRNLLIESGLTIFYADNETETSMSPSSFLVIAGKGYCGAEYRLRAVYPDPCDTLKRFHAEMDELCKAIRAWVVMQASLNNKIAIFGAGLHTEALLTLSGIDPETVHCIIDDDANKWGERIAGIEVVGSGVDRARECDAILVSTLSAESAILDRLETEFPMASRVGVYRDLTNSPGI